VKTAPVPAPFFFHALWQTTCARFIRHRRARRGAGETVVDRRPRRRLRRALDKDCVTTQFVEAAQARVEFMSIARGVARRSDPFQALQHRPLCGECEHRNALALAE